MVKNFVPVQPGEHPRILFRKHELPALRARAKTPLGKAALAKMDSGPVGLGVKYQITGDKQLAAKAIPLVEKLIEGGVVQASEVGQVIVEREEESAQSEAPPVSQEQLERESQSEGA